MTALLLLLLAFIFSTLSRSYRITQEAGLQRLEEKYPRRADALRRGSPRWHWMRGLLISLTAAAQIGSVLALSRPLRAHYPDHPEIYLALLIGFLMAYILAVIILPGSIAEHFADRISISTLFLVAPTALLGFPVSAPIALAERKLLHLFDRGADEEDSPTFEDEILSLVDQTDEEELEHDERQIIRSVFEFGDTVTREIMTPRVNLTGIEDNLTTAQAIEEVRDTPHSRFPLFHETMDEINGIIHVKDLLKALSQGEGSKSVAHAAIPPTFVPESMPINDLLQLLRNSKVQTAIVVDEYGGTAGLVTIEDVIEELVGEIEDEHDVAHTKFRRLPDGSALIDAALPVDEVNELLHIHIPERDEYDSVGGYLFHHFARIPAAGETLEQADFAITVQGASTRKLHKLKITAVS